MAEYQTEHTIDDGIMRTFDTGATRTSAEGKIEYARFFSPAVLRRYAEYLNEHRAQADGKLRDPDNWKKGIPKQNYMDSMARHFWEVWEHHTGERPLASKPLQDAICALMFNCMGYLFEDLREWLLTDIKPNGGLK